MREKTTGYTESKYSSHRVLLCAMTSRDFSRVLWEFESNFGNIKIEEDSRPEGFSLCCTVDVF